MGGPQPWRQKYPDGRGCCDCRSRLPGADAGAATRILFPHLCRIRGAEPSPRPATRNRWAPQIHRPHRARRRADPRPKKASASRLRIEADGPAPKPRRSRDKDHLRFISRQPCTVCGRQPCEAHHIRFAQPSALGRRVSDEFTVPLCRVHHRELHRIGNERSWWDQLNIDPVPIALRFWQQTRGVASEASDQPKLARRLRMRRSGRNARQGAFQLPICPRGLQSANHDGTTR